MRAETTTATEPVKFSKVAITLLAGMLIGLAASLIMLLIFSLVMTMRDVPQGIVPTLSAVSVALGSFAGGFTGAKLHKKSGLAIGAVTGFLMCLLLTLAGLAVQGAGMGASVLIKLVISLAAGGIGGIIGVNSHKRRKF